MEKVALVTGSSSGIGFETALALARENYFTYASMRNTSKAGKIQEIAKKENLNLKVIELDVDKEDSIKSAVKKIQEQKGRIDVLVNNAGYGLFGCIVNISSVAGRIGFPGTPAYISSKFALEGLSECMRYELSPFGIKTIIIEPGVIQTNFFSSMKVAYGKPGSPATELTEKVMNGVKMMAEMGTPPVEVAKTIMKAINTAEPLPRYVVGSDASMFLEAKKMKTDLEFENYIKKELFSD